MESGGSKSGDSRSRWARLSGRAKVAVEVAGLIVGLLALLGVKAYQDRPPAAPTRTPAAAAVSITTPRGNAPVKRSIKVSGRVERMPDAAHLWLFVQAGGRAPHGPAFYVQSRDPLVVRDRGRWTARAYVGSPGSGDAGRRFTLVAAIYPIEKTPAISRAIQRNHGHIGASMPALPRGVIAKSSVDIERR
jgi:hypothetical protein